MLLVYTLRFKDCRSRFWAQQINCGKGGKGPGVPFKKDHKKREARQPQPGGTRV